MPTHTHSHFLTGPPGQEEPLVVCITPTGRLVYDVARRVYACLLLYALVDTGPGPVLHMSQSTHHLHILRVVIHIHLHTYRHTHSHKWRHKMWMEIFKFRANECRKFVCAHVW